MISCDKGELKLRGSKTTLMAEFTCIVSTLFGNADGEPVMPDEELDMCVKTARLTDEELDAEVKKSVADATPEQLLAEFIETL